MLMYILTQNNTIIAKNKLTIWRLRSNIRIFAMFKFKAVQSRRVISAFFVPIHIEFKV